MPGFRFGKFTWSNWFESLFEKVSLSFDSPFIQSILDKFDNLFDGLAHFCPPLRKPPVIKKAPTELSAVEDTPSDLDLSGVKFKKFGRNKDEFILELKVTEGTLDATGTSKVDVVGAGTDTLVLTGTRKDVRKFLKDATAISYTGAEDDFGDDAAFLTISAASKRGTATIDPIGIDIEDVSDDQIGTPDGETLIGDNGMNTLIGLGGDDILIGLAGNDSLQGNEGDDVLRGGDGADTLEGGEGEDILQYTDATGGVNVDLNEDENGFQSASGSFAEGDVISGFENVYSSEFGDVVIGNDEDNVLFGYGGDDDLQGNDGDDVLRGDLGADTMDGGDGSDWLRYFDAASGVTIDLNADTNGFQSASGGEADGDVISNFENVFATDFADNITGDAGDNFIIAFAGDDTIDGGAGNDTIRGGEGADEMNGGDDKDLLQYTGAAGDITINLDSDGLGTQTASGGNAQGDVISGFENVYTGDGNDSITGDAARNILYGYGGEDSLNGGEGKDVLRGGADADTFIFDGVLSSDNTDRIIDFEIGIDTLQLDSLVFAQLSAGALDASNFLSNATGLADTADQFIIYDTTTGNVFYDEDGSGALDGVAFATLSSTPALSESDFSIV